MVKVLQLQDLSFAEAAGIDNFQIKVITTLWNNTFAWESCDWF